MTDATTSRSLDAVRTRAALLAPVGPYAALDVVESTGSTNADLAAAVRAGAPDRTVLIAERQTSGQGRRSRQWSSPAGTGLYVSVLVRPPVPPTLLGWLTLLAGVALVRTARRAGAGAVLKWPNDLLLGAESRKGAGVLAEVGAHDADGTPAVVVGMGLNVLPLPEAAPLGAGGLAATSLAEAGASVVDRTELAIMLLTELGSLEVAWRSAGGDPVASGLYDEYLAACSTLGQRVRVELPASELVGTASRLDPDGTLVVRDDAGTEHAVSAGDVVHLRAAS